MEVIVVGAGVIGLTSAIRLREAGFEAHIVAAEGPLDTVASAVAGAIWYPFGPSAETREADWGRQSLELFVAGADAGEPGLLRRDMVVLTLNGSADPWWADPLRGFRRCAGDELRAGYEDGYVQETVTINTIPHLEHLAQRLADLGGEAGIGHVHALKELTNTAGLIVNCAGVGAGRLAGDSTTEPIRGQVVRLRSEEVHRITMVEEGPLAYAYVMPHDGEVVVGGTREHGEWDRVPDDSVTEHLLEKAVKLEPTLAGAEVIAVKVGLRPGRPSVRLEHEPLPGTRGVIHNYGHAGNGWSLSWGCAEHVVQLARQATEG